MSIPSAYTNRATHSNRSACLNSVVDVQGRITMDLRPHSLAPQIGHDAGASDPLFDPAIPDAGQAPADFLAAHAVLDAARVSVSRVLRTVVDEFLR